MKNLKFRFSKKLRRRTLKPGMTLVEIMIVVIVMALIATGVAYAVVPELLRVRVQQTQTDARAVQSMVEIYMLRNAGQCPSSVDDLSFSSSSRRSDAWGNDFFIECEANQEPSVISAGPDGQISTGDDIRSTSSSDEVAAL